ncbi:uncharacterized protein LOC124196091 [Daphnia pulex]|uniref:uncharacterized protein LOC124196091 n=1 Tax=Daphnia pulex TaxID=6669 RepID=UPI001EDCB1EF|nr:uncharacterized protein LOC124196091 [Daphnia pulex]
MSRKEQIILRICVSLVLLLLVHSTGIKAANTDTAAIYNPVIPHRRMPYYPKTGTYYRPYPYDYDYDYRPAAAAAAAGTSSSSSANSYYYYPRYPYPYKYQNPSASSSGFHAANQLQFIGPIESASSLSNVNTNGPKLRPPQKRPRPRPTCTLMGLGGGMA